MKSFHASTDINAPPERVWALITDLDGYTSWNSTVESVEGSCEVGQTIKLKVKANPGRAFPVKVAVMDAPKHMQWRGGMPLGLFTGVRDFTIEPRDGGVTFTMHEEFGGPLSGLIGRSIPDLQPAFDDFAADLKKAAEAG